MRMRAVSLCSGRKFLPRIDRLRLTSAALALSVGVLALPEEAAAQVTATCMLNEVENRIYDPIPLSGTLKSTEEQLVPELPFRQYLPTGYDPAKKWPVIIFLHGIGELGGTLTKVTEHSLPRMVESPDWDWPFIVLSPVLPSGNWYDSRQLVGDIFDYAVNTLGGDPNRLYLTGISYGGEGTLAVGIELADRLAAIWPVTPGGEPDNWAQHAALASIPTMFLIGTADSQYANTQGWATDLETAGAPMFSEYSLPAAEEHQDTIPVSVLDESHVFVSYENIPHDVWHAAYGTFCDVLMAQKTVQYEWLLKQSLDGTPFVDPRDPGGNPGGGTGGGGAGGSGGSAGSAGTGVAGGGAGGVAGTLAGGAGGAAGTMTSMVPTAGTGTTAPPVAANSAGSEGSCALVHDARSGSRLWLSSMLALASTLLLRARRRQRGKR
jgi:predicted esterase